MKLLTLHRILIGTMIAFCAFFVWQKVRVWRVDHASTTLWIAIAFTAVAIALTWYLTNLKRFVHLEPPSGETTASETPRRDQP